MTSTFSRLTLSATLAVAFLQPILLVLPLQMVESAGIACLGWLHIVVVRPLRALAGYAERLAGVSTASIRHWVFANCRP